MEVVLLHNPGAGKADLSTENLAAMLRRAGFEPRAFSLKENLDNPAILSTGEFVIAAGGDGSVRDVALRLAHTGRPLAPLPLGTANNIAASLGIRGEPEAIIAGWAHARRRRVDLGVARGSWGEQRFIEGVGIGLVGRAIAIIDSIANASAHDYERREDELQRDVAVFLALAHEMPAVELSVSTDGHERRDRFLLLEVLNITRAGPRLELAPHADMSDGLLDVISVPVGERDRLKSNLLKHLAGPDRMPIFAAERARQIRIATACCDLRIDDELVFNGADDPAGGASERVTVDITVEPGALELVLPGE